MQNLSCVAGSPGSWVCLPWTRCGDRLVHQELPGDSTAPGSAWKGARSRAEFHLHPPAARSCLGQLPYSEYTERGGVGAVVKAVLQGVGWLQRSGRLLLAAGLGMLGSPARVTA